MTAGTHPISAGPRPAGTPSLAFLIPTRNRHGALPRTLARVLATRDSGDEVMICDQSAQAFAAPPGVRVLHRPDLNGLPAARNALLAATRADIAVFLDDDTDLARDFAPRLRALAAAEPGIAGWGPVCETRPRRLQRLFRLAQFGVFHDPRRLLARRCDRPTTALFGCCFAVRVAPARATGFDGRRPGYALGEDLDFCLRLRAPLRFARDLRAIHRREGAGRAAPWARGVAKGRFLLWLARRHGGGNPATLLHLALALAAAASGRGDEPASPWGVLSGLMAGGSGNGTPPARS
jgi:GT2 family glycosyltransferase